MNKEKKEELKIAQESAKRWEEEALRFHKNSEYWREKYESLKDNYVSE